MYDIKFNIKPFDFELCSDWDVCCFHILKKKYRDPARLVNPYL